jgi:hypothetical protein
MIRRHISSHVRCHFCGRLLVPTKQEKLPAHRVPREGCYDGPANVGLTGADSPWCQGGGQLI